MEYIISRSFELHVSAEKMRDYCKYNLWKRKCWPYSELVKGDILYWYENSRARILWKSEVSEVFKFKYETKNDLECKLKGKFGDFEKEEKYYLTSPQIGYCLSWKIKSLRKLNIPKPVNFRFSQLGWLKVNQEINEIWGLNASIEENIVLDQLAEGNSLIGKLRSLNEIMTGLSPERVVSIASHTIRKDTKLIMLLKRLSGYQCQFPSCKVKIPTRTGRYYIEVAHIAPVKKGGKSILGNLIVLCPNHHKEFDYGFLKITKQIIKEVDGILNGREFKILLPN